MQSPRRSPRISAESSKKQSPSRKTTSSTGSSGKARASTGALKADKENDPNVSPAARRAKTVRRAYSVGGEMLKKAVIEKDNTLSVVPSRRNVPGPRKSAIRALPPQVFKSPSTTPPLPQIRTAFASASSDSISAFGGAELMDLMNSVGPTRKALKPDDGQLKQRNSMPSAIHTNVTAVVVNQTTVDEDDNTIARKKRRVTFNPYQERTDFYLEEPTMRIRPSGETEPVTMGNSTGSHDSSDMSLDSDDSGLQSVDESSMEITTIEPNGLLDASVSDESAMEMTTAYGGVLDRTSAVALLPSGQEDVDDDSESEQQSSDDEQSIARSDKDMTVTMQFTSIYGADTSDSHIEESQENEEEEEEDNEVDMELTEVDENSVREDHEETINVAEEDDSAMEMTEVYDQPTESVSPRKGRTSAALSHRHSTLLSEQDEVAASPRIGHEYCKIPAADSPKHNLSAATLKALAGRQSMSQSPIKPAVTPSKTKLGNSTTSPSKAPFRSSSNNDEKGHNRQSLPGKSNGSPPHSHSAFRQSSPPKSPTTPSRVWRSFRRSQGEGDSPPAKRIAVDPQSPSRSGFGTPQRIVVQSKPVMQPSISLKEEEAGVNRNEDKVTMKQFFDSLDLGFLDLSMPSKRRVDRDDKAEALETDSAELIKAACAHLPFLDSLVGACEELKSTVIDGRTIAIEDERAFYDHPPLYVAEMASMTSAAERQRAISAFKIQKAAARASALQAYYAWRTDRQFSDANLRKWEDVRIKLEDDVQFVQETSKLVESEILPVLRFRHQQLAEQVEMERSRQKLLEKSDDEEMNELHRAMEEQSGILAEQQASHREAQEELERLQLQVKQITARQKEAEEAIDLARTSYESITICTKEEAIRLARQTKHLETLHLWTLHRAGLGEIVLELEDCLLLTLTIQKAAKSSASINVIRGGNIWQDTLQQAVNDRISSSLTDIQPAEIIRFVTTAWTRMRHLANVYEVLLARFPTDIHLDDKQSSIVISASVLLPRRRSKVIVEARCEMARLLQCKSSLFGQDDIAADCVYGSVDAPAIAAQITDCITMGSSAGDLTNAILEAIETFD